jgi:hypothetical protein
MAIGAPHFEQITAEADETVESPRLDKEIATPALAMLQEAAKQRKQLQNLTKQINVLKSPTDLSEPEQIELEQLLAERTALNAEYIKNGKAGITSLMEKMNIDLTDKVGTYKRLKSHLKIPRAIDKKITENLRKPEGETNNYLFGAIVYYAIMVGLDYMGLDIPGLGILTEVGGDFVMSKIVRKSLQLVNLIPHNAPDKFQGRAAALSLLGSVASTVTLGLVGNTAGGLINSALFELMSQVSNL